MTYHRLKIKTPDGERWVWAAGYNPSATGMQTFRVVGRDGEPRNELIVALPEDVLCARPATMNLKYAELEAAR